MKFCGIDIGTTNTKAVLIDANGGLIDRASIATQPPQAGIKAIRWYEHFCDIFDYFASKGHFADSKVICSITAQGGSFILLNEKFNPVSRVYSWIENADDDTTQDMINALGAEGYYHITGRPVFDDCNFITHPGRDILEGCFGNIIGTGNIMKPIGRGLDELLAQLNITTKQLVDIKNNYSPEGFPEEPIAANNINEMDTAHAVRSYMEATGSFVAFLLEKFQPEKNGKIIMSGGAARSSFWPQVIADLCGLAVEAINFPEFTAYGAAIHAKSAFEGKQSSSSLLSIAESRHYEPIHADQYQRWYTQHQKPLFEKLLTANRK